MRADPLFWGSFLLTLKFVVIAVTLEFLLGFGLAYLIFKFVARQRLLTTLLLIPMMIAPVAVGLIWRLLLQGDFGMVTYYLRAVRPTRAELRRAVAAGSRLRHHRRHRRLAVDALRHSDHACRPDEPAACALRGRDDGRRGSDADLPRRDAAAAAPDHRAGAAVARHRRLQGIRQGVLDDRRRAGHARPNSSRSTPTA